MLTVSEPVENFTETCSPELALHKLNSKTHSFASSRSCKNGQELGFEELGFRDYNYCCRCFCRISGFRV
jgi:hypothetical protein